MKKAILIVCVTVIAAEAVEAEVIGRSAFSGSAVTETFENITQPNKHLFTIPTPFLLPCGAIVSKPAPNRSDSFATMIVDRGGFFGYAFDTIAPYLPSGSAYVGQANAGLFDQGVVFTFPQDMLRVGAYVAADPWQGQGGPIHITAYDASGLTLETTLISHATVEGWRDRFLGFKRNEGIRSLRFRGEGGAVLRLDDLTFEPVPEPATLSLLALGGLELVRRRKRRACK